MKTFRAPRGRMTCRNQMDSGKGDEPRPLKLQPEIQKPLIPMLKTILTVLAGAMLLLVINGCVSFTNEPSGYLTYVTINNQTDSAIMQATTNVFISHGFSGGKAGTDQCLFHRPGTRTDNLAYGNAMFDEKVILQVTVQLDHIDSHTTVVGCNAALVQEAGDPFFADNHPIHRLGKSPYKRMLQEIQAKLSQ